MTLDQLNGLKFSQERLDAFLSQGNPTEGFQKDNFSGDKQHIIDIIYRVTRIEVDASLFGGECSSFYA